MLARISIGRPMFIELPGGTLFCLQDEKSGVDDVACEPAPWQLMQLSQLISREKNPELREALEALDEFMNGY